jgi:hypothetical protein
MNTMKTRIISITMGVLFAALTVAGATNSRNHKSSTASSHENATEQNSANMVPLNPSPEATIMEEWIESRDNWEQTEQNTVSSDLLMDSEMLEEWMLSRDNWEQGDQDLKGENVASQSSLLDEWVAGTENWEQE